MTKQLKKKKELLSPKKNKASLQKKKSKKKLISGKIKMVIKKISSVNVKKKAVAKKSVSVKKATSRKQAHPVKAIPAKLKVKKAALTKETPPIENEVVTSYEPKHESVLLKEVIEHLDLAKKKIVVDATLGLGGHSLAILENLPENGKLIAFDADSAHAKLAQKNLKSFKERVVVVNANFVQLEEQLKQLKVKQIDAIVFDLGLASPHVDVAARGFSFLREGPLDMRFDTAQKKTAAEVVNTVSEKELIRIFQEYGEERRARRIAQEIVKTRKRKPYTSTTQLAKMIEKLVPREGHIHPATRVFQALRVAVNNELDVLQEALTQAIALLKPNGRVAVISYHSLEDRIVKRFFKAHAVAGSLQLITKKPLTPTEDELRQNPRSRSAKLRVAQKL